MASQYVMVRVSMNDGVSKWSQIRIDVMQGIGGPTRHLVCRAFGLDEISVWFEMPSSVQTLTGNSLVNGRKIDGFVYRGPKDTRPIGSIHVAYCDENFREHDAESGGHLRLGK